MTASPSSVAAPPSMVDSRPATTGAGRWQVDRAPWLPALAVAALAAGVGGVQFTRRQLWYDEYATWFVTTLSWPAFERLLGNIDIVHALYYVVMRGWTALAGDSVLALRLPSLLGLAVAAGALTLLGRRLGGTAVGVTAGLVYAAIPSVSRFGQEARAYSWVAAVGLLSTLVLLRAMERPGWRRWLLYGASLVLLVHLHLAAALLVPAHGVLAAVLHRPDQPRVWWRWLITVGGAGLLTVPLIFEASTQSGQVAWIRADAHAVRQYLPNLFGSPVVAWVVVPLGLLGAAVLWYTNRRLLAGLLAWALVPPLVSYLVFDWVHLFLAKYALYTVPAWALFAAIGLVVPLGALRRWLLGFDVAVLLAVALALVAVAGLDGQAEFRRTRVIGEPDFRAAAALIDARFRPGDGIAYAGFNILGRPRQPMSYELKTATPRDVFAAGASGSNGWYGAPECIDPAPCLGEAPRIWLLVNPKAPDPMGEMPPAQAALLRQHYTATPTASFAYVDVELLIRRPA